ncbi:hypothetical protein [Dermatophilus congolensis]|uniref:Uncharacterized protein n=1 Tax=Dermatophilus congolensis TaxID=1863 RepID=A0A239V6M5_9MICO|nr:hypothetical protein [Dermatophilus congolensis]MBO3130182.1 hypothetical protein [Dermatophilus congolensis]MBO3131191.1 hypothetical protein [Dermatophilus congolensis]MBO3134653.1 hypothetical protein [Dermatophilus congolensis]MBO3136890.1 hypothetical protein [Dermatophilus congolensis]MBO3139134.1 hypothetical protein [Dermatophilus congolensis]
MDRIRLVVRVLPRDSGSKTEKEPVETVDAVFMRSGLFSVVVPRIGEFLECRAFGEHVAKYFPRAVPVVALEHRITDMREDDPRVYVVVDLHGVEVTPSMVTDFKADGFQLASPSVKCSR